MSIANGRARGRFAAWMSFNAPPPAQRPASIIGTGLFVWCLLITTVEGFSASDVGLSRTREIMTCYAVAVIVLVQRPWRWWPRYLRLAAAALAGLVLVGYLSWLLEGGSALAVNFWSQWMMPVAVFFLGSTFLPGLWPTWRRALVVYGCSVGLYQAAVLLRGLGPVTGSGEGSSFYSGRSISASLAMVMLTGMVLVATDEQLSARTRNLLAGFLGVSAVLAQHRTVWIALIVASVLLAWRYARMGRDSTALLGPTVSFGFLVLAAVLPLVTRISLLPAGGGGDDPGRLPQSFEDTNTLGWRWEMWTSRMQAERSWVEWLLGGAFGETPAWGPNSSVLVPLIGSHNMYVDLLSMLGVFGLLVFLLLLGVALSRTGDRLSAPAITIWALLVYGIFNQWPPFAWFLLAAALLSSEGVGHGFSRRARATQPASLPVPQPGSPSSTVDDGAP